jgi:hypothetical protein
MTSSGERVHELGPILVTGMPRSGTTWVARVLCESDRVGFLNEPFNLARDPGTLRIPVDRWFEYITVENEELVLPALADALGFRYPLMRELWQCRTRTDVRHTLKWWWAFVRDRGRRPLVKEPHAVFSAPWFSRRLGSDVVIIVRHPAAVVSSWKRLGWSFDFNNLLTQPALLRDWLEPFELEMRAALEPPADRIDRVALLWHVIHGVVGEYRKRFPEFHVVRQEDLSRNPTEQFRRLYEQLRIPFTNEIARAVSSSSSEENPKETRVESPHETRLDSMANLESWRRRLNPAVVTRIRRLTECTAGLYYREDDW